MPISAVPLVLTEQKWERGAGAVRLRSWFSQLQGGPKK